MIDRDRAAGRSRGPLDGYRVLSLENYYAGNVGTHLMARYGAEVIKIEMPGVGDELRRSGPQKTADGITRTLATVRLMSGKKSIAVDLGSDVGMDIFWRLVVKSDVVWTNMKPSSLAKLGISFESLTDRNPAIVYSTVSGFGHDDLSPAGPYGDWTAFDVIVQGLAGLQWRASAEDPSRPGYNGIALGDWTASVLGAMGTVTALLSRKRDGGAQRVDVAMHDAMIALGDLPLTITAFTGSPPPRGRSGTSAPYGQFRSADGFVNIGVGGTPVWKRFCAAIGRLDLTDDPRFAAGRDRVAHYRDLDQIVEEWTSTRSTEIIVETLLAAAVPCAPVLDMPDVVRSPQVAARHMLQTVNDPVLGDTPIVGNPIKMLGLSEDPPHPPPELGEDTDTVLHDLLGLSPEQLGQLRSSGAIG